MTVISMKYLVILNILIITHFPLNCVSSDSSVFTNKSHEPPVDISALLKSFEVGYDRRVRPDYGGEPVSVGVTLYVLSVSEISEKFMDFTFDMYFRQFWKDGRLGFDIKNGITKLVVAADYIKQIWVPDTFFVNEKTAYFHVATQENQFLRITHLGEILRSMRLTVKATCPMDLSYFPMDSQLCTLEIESYGYTMADLVFSWHDGIQSVQVDPRVGLSEFYVRGYRQRWELEQLTSGNYSRLCADILFSRSMGYYIIQVYVPSSLIVVMSWVSFYLDRSSAPARVGLGVTTVLTMVTLMGSVNSSLPKISYMKALDIYLAFCFCMVFGALLEYATVSYSGKRIKMNQKRLEEFQRNVEEMRTDLAKKLKVEQQLVRIEEDSRARHHLDGCPAKLNRQSILSDKFLDFNTRIHQPPYQCPFHASDIERYSRIAFPVLFISFHLVYWTLLTSVSEITVQDLVPLKEIKTS